MDGELKITDVRVRDDGAHIHLELDIDNRSDRTMYAVSAARGYEWDAAQKRLLVRLYDTPPDPSTEMMPVQFVPPPYKPLEPDAVTTIALKLPRVLRRMNLASATMELFPVHDADRIDVEVAVNEKPFYPDTRGAEDGIPTPADLRAASAKWGATRLSATWRRPDAAAV